MATAAIPLLFGLAPQLINLIVGLIHKHAPAAEADMGPSTGAVKFAQVFQAVMTDLQNAAAAGQIDKTLPADQVVQTIIQSVVHSLQLTGGLGAPAPVTTTTLPAPSTVISGTFQINPGGK